MTSFTILYWIIMTRAMQMALWEYREALDDHCNLQLL